MCWRTMHHRELVSGCIWASQIWRPLLPVTEPVSPSLLLQSLKGNGYV